MNILNFKNAIAFVTSSVQEKVVETLTPRQEKIAVLAIIAFGAIAMMFYTLYSRWTKRKAIALKDEGILLYGQGKYEEAGKQFQKALEYDSNNPETLKRYGKALLGQKKCWEAIKPFNEALKINPEDLEALKGYAKALPYYNKIEVYEKILAINSKDMFALKGYGNVLCMDMKYGDALMQYKKAMEIDPKSVAHSKGFSKILCICASEDQIKFAEVSMLFEKCLEINPDNFSLLVSYAQRLKKQGNVAEAEIKYKKALEINPKNSSALQLYLDFLFDQGREDEAEELSKKIDDVINEKKMKRTTAAKVATERNPTSIHALIEYGRALNDQSHYEEALKQFEKVAAMDLNNNEFFQLWNRDYLTALTSFIGSFRRDGKFEEAAKQYEKAFKWCFSEWEFLIRYADLLRQQQKYEDAALYYKKVILQIPSQDRPALRRCLTAYGETLRELGKYDEAITQYRKYSQLTPSYSFLALRGYAETLRLQGSYADAVLKFKECLGVKNDAEVAIHYAAALAKLGSIDEARGELDRILALNDPELSEEVAGYIASLTETGAFEVKKLSFHRAVICD